MTRARDVANIDGILTTTGDTFYASSGGTPARLGIGSTGNVLTVSGGVPAWAAPAGGGKVLQVVMGTTTTEVTSTTNTYADTGLTATITPSATTSKILVLVAQNGFDKDISDTGIDQILLRGATQISFFAQDAGFTNSATGHNAIGGVAINYLDSPATTSATTYKTQFRSNANTSRVRIQWNNAMSSIILMEIGA